MDTTGSAAAAVPAHDTADALGDLLLDLEDVRGCFSGSLIDYRMPCTASEDSRCQIVASIPLWNEFLCWLELELRELPGEERQLGLVHIRNVCHMRPTQIEIRQAAALLRCLLKTHRCVASIQIPDHKDDPEMAYWCSVVICCELNENDSIKSLALEVSSPVQSKRFCEVLLSMKRLEELHCAVSFPDATFPNTVSALLLASATLTVLDFNAPLVATTPNRLLLNALKVNSMLRDLTLSYSAIIEDPGSFLDFLSTTVVLKRLKVVGCPYANSRDSMKWIFQGMLKNKTVSSLEAHELRLDDESVKLAGRMLAHSKVLQSLRLWRCLCFLGNPIAELLGTIDRIDTASWVQAIATNCTLQHLTLSLNVWTSECWEQFFRVLSRHRSLKMVTLVTDKNDRDRLADIANKLEEIGCEEKVIFVDSCNGDRFSLADCKNYSELFAYVRATDKRTALSVYQELSTFPPFTFLSVVIEEWEKELCWLFAEFISTTPTLQKLKLELRGRSLPAESHDWWPALSQSLLHSRSIVDLALGVYMDPCRDVECLGEAVVRSKTIRKLRLCRWTSSACDSFLRYLHSVISENYALCSVDVDFEFVCLPWQAHWLTVVRDTARRNSGYVTRAAQFLNGRRCDTPCAAALDRVYRHPALVAELSKVLSISEADAVVAVRQRFRSIEGMHEFMRLAGVVKERVTCQPRDDGRAQLDALDEHCWARVRRYLQLDDVVWDRRS